MRWSQYWYILWFTGSPPKNYANIIERKFLVICENKWEKTKKMDYIILFINILYINSCALINAGEKSIVLLSIASGEELALREANHGLGRYHPGLQQLRAFPCKFQFHASELLGLFFILSRVTYNIQNWAQATNCNKMRAVNFLLVLFACKFQDWNKYPNKHIYRTSDWSKWESQIGTKLVEVCLLPISTQKKKKLKLDLFARRGTQVAKIIVCDLLPMLSRAITPGDICVRSWGASEGEESFLCFC